MGNKPCGPSPGTVDEIFSVARNSGIVPDLTLDRTLASFLSLDSADALTRQHADLRVSLREPHLSDFNQNLASMFGEGQTVVFGSVGVVALALSLLLEVLSLRVAGRAAGGPSDPIRRIFGADHFSDVGSIASEYLKRVPRLTGDPVPMRALTERCESELSRELADRYEAMTAERQIGANGVKQWLNGAALHLHMRVHLVRLGAARKDSARSLAGYYKDRVPVLMRSYVTHLRGSIREHPPPAGGPSRSLLVLEPLRNVSHAVRHRPCESEAVAAELADRILGLLDLRRSLDFFNRTETHVDALVEQRGNFSLWPHV